MPSRLNQTRTAVDYLLESALAGTNVMPEEEPAPRGFFARLKGLFADPEVLGLEKSVKVASLRLQQSAGATQLANQIETLCRRAISSAQARIL